MKKGIFAKNQLGNHLLDSSIKNTMDYIKLVKYTESDAAKEAALEIFMVVFFLRGSNRTINGKLIEDFRTRYLMGHN